MSDVASSHNASLRITRIQNLKNGVDLLSLNEGGFVPVTQYTENSLTMELYNAFIGEGQPVWIVGQISINGQFQHFEAIAKVAKLDVIVESFVQFEFQITQTQSASWKSFLDSKLQAQNRVDALLKKMKGGETDE
ncbi:MAG: hypothetical protein ACK5Y2_14070 [Bdellovibrionales bacterium]